MNLRARGYLFACLAILIFALQDIFTKYLGDRYPPIVIAMIRFWAFSLFGIAVAASSTGGLRRVITTRHVRLQFVRGFLLVAEIATVIAAFRYSGLALSQSIFQVTPLMITLLSIPLLGETVGWRRGCAVVVGLVGVLVIINPVGVQVDISILLPLAGALLFSLYSIATRAVSRNDLPETSLLYVSVVGALVITLVGPFYWVDVKGPDWLALAALCLCGTLSHYFLIKAYSLVPVSEVQPLSYIQLVLNIIAAIILFGEVVTINMLTGATIVVVAGLYTVWRETKIGQRPASTSH